MKREHAAACTVGLFLLLAGCGDSTPPDTSAADQKAIKDGEVAWNADLQAKNVDKIMAHYADDASLLAPDMPIMKGKDAIRAGITQMLADPNAALSFANDVVVTSKSGDLAYSQGTYTMTMTNAKTKQPETEKGKYVTVYKKQADGSWKAVEDMNNADAPAVSQAPAPKAKKSAPAARKKKR